MAHPISFPGNARSSTGPELHKKAHETITQPSRQLLRTLAGTALIAATLTSPRVKEPVPKEFQPAEVLTVEATQHVTPATAAEQAPLGVETATAIPKQGFPVEVLSPTSDLYPSSSAVPLEQLTQRYGEELSDDSNHNAIIETYLRMRYAEDTLASVLDIATDPSDNPVVLQRSLDLASFFTKKKLTSNTPIPVDMNSAILLARGIDHTRDLRTPSDDEPAGAALAEGWNILYANTKQLLESPHSGTYNPHDVLHDAFERSELTDKPIMEQLELATRIDTALELAVDSVDAMYPRPDNLKQEAYTTFLTHLLKIYSDMHISHPDTDWGPIDQHRELSELDRRLQAHNLIPR